ncbi:MAG: beta-Ala-His dipeptidase [Selenomonadaceae bacterium]|nr:beta-Ala-His dipeptidase [Selenomonadaceae bacterium]
MSQILEEVLAEFSKLAAIPRPSKHEQAISNFLCEYLTDLGVSAMQDLKWNVIAEIPASAGYEGAPLTILQSHMDMVCVAEAGYEYNALRDPIKLVRTEKFLEAESTSLGADDGMGIAEILYVLKHGGEFKHGPIRVIFTVDEEQGMSGALNLNEKYLADAAYMINCDSEIFEEIVVGSAGNVHVDFSREINYVAPNENFTTAVEIKISGLSGGHSGLEIAKSRANAVKVMGNFLRAIRDSGNFQLASFSAGTAPNVIPSEAEVVIVTNLPEPDISETGEIFAERVKKIYGAQNFKVEVAVAQVPDKVFSAEDFESLSELITLIHSGVYSMNGEEPLTSANIGIIRTGESIEVSVLARSNISELLADFINLFAQTAKVTGFGVKFGTPAPAWDFKPNSRLAEIAAEIFTEQNGFAPKVHTSHGGLECSFFAAKNPSLDIISTGTTNENIHSPKERLHLETVEPHVKLIIETLKKIAAVDTQGEK